MSPWLLSIALFSPVVALYAAYFIFAPAGVVATGFIQYDQPSYMADARGYFANGHFAFTYGLPFSSDPATPAIYFQPITFLLGIALHLSNADPGLVYVAAGFILGILCCRAFVELYDEVLGRGGAARYIGLICFVWGGGFVALAGIVYAEWIGDAPGRHLVDFDDGFGGWWFLNLGRNLIFPVEAFYHLFFFAGVLAILRRRFVVALLCVVVLAASHPFTGLELIGVISVWAIAETLFGSEHRPPLWFTGALAAVGLLHIGYYLIYLPHASAEYRAVQQQWTLPWLYHYWNFLVSDGLVAVFAAAALVFRWRRHGNLDWRQRLFVIWFVVAIVLANHDLLIRPIQPLHFTRGYIWSPLFLLGVPALLAVIDMVLRRPVVRILGVAALLCLFLADNGTWFASRIEAAANHGPDEDEITLDPSEREVLTALGAPDLTSYLLVSQNEKIGYLATAYTPLRSWYSHRFTTPDAETKKSEQDVFFDGRGEPSAWHGRALVLVLERSSGDALYRRLVSDGFRDRLADDRLIIMTRAAR